MARKAKKKISKKTKKKVTRKKKAVNIVREAEIPASIQKIGYSRKKLNILLGYLTFFIILFVVSAILYSVAVTEFYLSLFFMLALIFGAFSITLLIVLLIYVFLKVLNK